jgi:hypothetical protein
MPAAAVAIPAVVSLIQSQGQSGSQGQTAAAGQLQQNAATQGTIGTSALGQSAGYFGKLAGGNRAVMSQALGPQISSLNDVYGGTARTLARFTRGPTQQVQMAESERERGGQIGSLFSTARTGANQALAGIGQGAFQGSTGAAAGAGSIFGQQVGQSLQGEQMGMQAGAGVGNLLFNLLKMYKGGGQTPNVNAFGMGATSGAQGPGGG